MEFYNLGDGLVDHYIKFHKKNSVFLSQKSTEVKIPAAKDREF